MKIFLTITTLAAAAFMSGCCNHPTQFLATDAPEPIPVTAVQSSGKIVLDGKIDEKAQRMEKATKAIKSFSRLDNAKVALEEMENLCNRSKRSN